MRTEGAVELPKTSVSEKGELGSASNSACVAPYRSCTKLSFIEALFEAYSRRLRKLHTKLGHDE